MVFASAKYMNFGKNLRVHVWFSKNSWVSNTVSHGFTRFRKYSSERFSRASQSFAFPSFWVAVLRQCFASIINSIFVSFRERESHGLSQGLAMGILLMSRLACLGFCRTETWRATGRARADSDLPRPAGDITRMISLAHGPEKDEIGRIQPLRLENSEALPWRPAGQPCKSGVWTVSAKKKWTTKPSTTLCRLQIYRRSQHPIVLLALDYDERRFRVQHRKQILDMGDLFGRLVSLESQSAT